MIIDPNVYKKVTYSLRKNLVDVYQTYLGSFGSAKKYEFYDLSSVIEQPWLKRPKDRLLTIEIIPDFIEI